jgi:hypothetical protein
MRNAVLGFVLIVSGCQTWGPTWSEVSGAHYYDVTILNRRAAVIESIDGNSAYPTYPIKIAPGEHAFVIGSPQPGWPGPNLVAGFKVDMEPCKRYYINAQFTNPVNPTFVPVVAYVEDIAGCKINVAQK